jgi:hypothetical protein
MLRHVGAHPRSITAAAWIKSTIAVAHTGLGLLSLGVSKQYQAHGGNIDSYRYSLACGPM